jgi:toxin FitB
MVNGYLLDTNLLSELVRLQPNPGVVDWVDQASEDQLFISVLTLGEIRQGLAGLPRGKRRTRLEGWFEADLRARFSGRILAVDSEVADRWGMLAAEARGKGTPLPVIDGLLAATALCHSLAIVTRNEQDFLRAKVPVVNPWTR